MKCFKLSIKKDIRILALGAESAGIFALYRNGNIFVSENFGDLLEEGNFLKYKKAVFDYLKKENITPDVILTDLHPAYKTTIFGEELAVKLKARHIKIQHHIAHIFSAVGDYFLLQPTTYNLQPSFFGIAMDGTGYGLDGNIWGGEIFKISNDKFQMTNQIQNPKSKMKINKGNLYIERIGSLEDQVMIGGDLAVREPARMLIAILARIMNQESRIMNKNQNSRLRLSFGRAKQGYGGQAKIIKTKKNIYKFVKKYYTRNELELLYNQSEQGFNCQATTSTGRVLDAVSVLLGFAGNERNYKHEAVKLLEENSTVPYENLDLRFMIYDLRMVLDTTYLFEYLLKNINRDKKRLAATAQLYIAEGFYEIVKKNIQYPISNIQSVFAAGGMTNNKIISSYLESRGVYLSKKIPRGDEGIALGQIIFYLLNDNQ